MAESCDARAIAPEPSPSSFSEVKLPEERKAGCRSSLSHECVEFSGPVSSMPFRSRFSRTRRALSGESFRAITLHPYRCANQRLANPMFAAKSIMVAGASSNGTITLVNPHLANRPHVTTVEAIVEFYASADPDAALDQSPVKDAARQPRIKDFVTQSEGRNLDRRPAGTRPSYRASQGTRSSERGEPPVPAPASSRQ